MFHNEDMRYKSILNIPDLHIEGHRITCITG